MRAGKRQHLLSLQVKTAGAANAYGEKPVTWTEFGKEWAAVEPLSMTSLARAKEAILAGAETNVDLVVLTMPIRTDVTPQCRAVEGSRIYDIVAVRPTNRADELVLIATVGANNG
jgi:head-tail adaptor